MDMMSLRRRVMVNQNKLMTATGNPITFNTPLTKPLKECVVRFTPKQEGNGTPSPENVREIVGKNSITVYQQGDDGVTHETSVSFPAVGKNLFDPQRWPDDGYATKAENYTINGDEIKYTASVDYGSVSWCQTPKTVLEVKPNTKYSITILKTEEYYQDDSGSYANDLLRVYSLDENLVGTTIGSVQKISDGKMTVTVTTPSTCKYLRLGLSLRNKIKKGDYTTWKVMVETSSEPTAYEPFDNTIYGGYVDLVKGELVAEYYKVPSSAFIKYRQNNGYIAYYYRAPDFESGIPRLCNLIGEYGSFSTSNMTKNIIQSSRVGGKTYLALDETVDINTLEIVYPLAEPIHYSLTPRILTTLQGVNTMWSDGDELAIKYWTR